VDGALGAAGRQAVERYLQDNPDEAERLADYRVQRAALAAALAGVPGTADDRHANLGAALADRLARHARLRRGAGAAVAACLVLAAAMGGWAWRGRIADERDSFAAVIAQQAAQGYRIYAGSGGFADRGAGEKPADPFGWLAERAMGRHSMAPDLAQAGYKLTGGWVFPTQYGNAVQLLYRNAAGQGVTLYVVYGGSSLPEAFSYARDDDLSLLFWQDGDVGYCLAGELDRPGLLAIADVIAAQLKTASPLPLAKEVPGAGAVKPLPGNVLPMPSAKPTMPGQVESMPATEEVESDRPRAPDTTAPAAAESLLPRKS
jgi:anti-sigma factor RsiW